MGALLVALPFVALTGCGAGSPPAPASPTVVVLPSAAPAPSQASAPASSSAPRADDDRAGAAPDGDADDAAVASDGPLESHPPIRVEAPPFAAAVKIPPAANGVAKIAPKLVKVAETRNGITDTDAWFRRVGKLPTLEVPNPFLHVQGNLPADLPARYGSNIAILAIDHGDHVIVVYGANFSRGRYVAIFDLQHRLLHFFDFVDFMEPPAAAPQDAMFVHGGVRWAELRDGVLYVSTGHRTYAKSSLGKNAFLTAVDPSTGRIRWQSAPLVANAANFLVHGGFILTGYGFTKEPDFLYVIDRDDGSKARTVPVRSGPGALIEKSGKLYVRTYDTDLVFDIR